MKEGPHNCWLSVKGAATYNEVVSPFSPPKAGDLESNSSKPASQHASTHSSFTFWLFGKFAVHIKRRVHKQGNLLALLWQIGSKKMLLVLLWIPPPKCSEVGTKRKAPSCFGLREGKGFLLSRRWNALLVLGSGQHMLWTRTLFAGHERWKTQDN